MADEAQQQNQDEARKRREEEQRRQAQQKKRESAKGEGEKDQFADKRSAEDQRRDIQLHNERAQEVADEALEEKLEEYDPEALGYRGNGGMDIVDTRQSQSVFSPPTLNVDDSNLEARRQLAEENRNVGAREEEQARRAHPNDSTARAEVIARR